MKNINACFTHDTDDWKTPTNLFNFFIDFGFIDLFPFKCNFNQFDITYIGSKLFINPPFSRLKDIPNYIDTLLSFNNSIVLLMPSRTDTTYFFELLKFNPTIYFIKGRLHFNDSDNSAPFPTILLHFVPNSKTTLYKSFSFDCKF